MQTYFVTCSRFAFVMAGALGFSLVSACSGGGTEVLDRVVDTVEELTEEKEFSPTCGVVGESLREKVDAEDGVFLSQASAIAPNIVSADPGTGAVTVTLLSLDFSSPAPEQAVSRLSELVSEGVYLFQRPDPCSVTTPSGASAISGQLITSDGVDVAEQLVREGLAGGIVGTGNCGEEMLAPCYESLRPAAAQ